MPRSSKDKSSTNKAKTQSPPMNNIFPKLMDVQYVALDISSAYPNFKLHKKSSYSTTFSCQFSRHMYLRLPFGASPAEDMSQKMIDIIFKELPNVFGTADDILIVGCGGTSHDRIIHRKLHVCRKENLNFSKDECHCRCTSFPFFEEIISMYGVQPDPGEL